MRSRKQGRVLGEKGKRDRERGREISTEGFLLFPVGKLRKYRKKLVGGWG